MTRACVHMFKCTPTAVDTDTCIVRHTDVFTYMHSNLHLEVEPNAQYQSMAKDHRCGGTGPP